MSKTIISQLISSINNRSVKEHALADKDWLEQDERVYLRQQEDARSNLAAFIDNMEPMDYSLVPLEFEGGSPEFSSRIVSSALNTAYTALFWSYLEKEGIKIERDVQHETLFDVSTLPEHMRDQTYDGGDETIEHLPFEDALTYSSALLSWGEHMSNIKSSGKRQMPFSWLLSMGQIKSFRSWCIDRKQTARNPQMAAAFDLASNVLIPYMHINDVPAVLKVWFDELVDDGTYDSRRQRIITRVSNRRFNRLVDACRRSDGEEVLKCISVPELILVSPEYHQAHREWLASPEYQLHQTNKVLKEQSKQMDVVLQQQELQMKQLQILQMQKQMEQLNQQMAANAKLIAEQMAKFAQPKVEEPEGEEVTPKEPEVVPIVRAVDSRKATLSSSMEEIRRRRAH